MNTNVNNTNIGTIGKLIIPEAIENIINVLHGKVGNTEWSGILFYKLIRGNIKTMKNLEFAVDFIYPMNIGSSAYTEFEYGSKVLEAYDVKEDLMESETGLVHTHHNMGAFFSGTDISEMCDNVSNFNYYVSLVLDFKKEYKCKIAFPTKAIINKKYSIKDSDGKVITITSKKEQLEVLFGDLTVEIENNALDIPWLNEKIIKLQEEKKATTVAKSYMGQGSLYGEEYGMGGAITDCYTPTLEITDVQFTNCLLNLDISGKNKSTYTSLKELSTLELADISIYEEGLEATIERIYTKCYPKDIKLLDLGSKCLAALLEISKYKVFEDEDIVINMKEILKTYV